MATKLKCSSSSSHATSTSDRFLGYNCCYVLILFTILFLLFTSVNNQLSINPTSSSENLNIKALQNIAEQFGRKIRETFEDASAIIDIRSDFLIMNPTIQKRDGAQLVKKIKKDMETMLKEKVVATGNIVKKAEEAQALYEAGVNLDVDYPNSKELNLTLFPLEPNARFNNISVNELNSTVHVPTNVFDKSNDILNGVEWSKALDEVFTDNFRIDPTLTWQYFCSIDGFFRNFPGIAWNNESVDLYDCRTRGWYIQAATSPKDVIILVDSSGSMKGQRMEIAKATVDKILDTLSDNDFFNVIKFSETADYADQCFNETLIQANADNKERMKEQLRVVETRAIAMFDKALTEAFELFRKMNDTNNGTLCNRAIMLITDGAPDNYEEIYRKYNWPHKNVRVFTYLIGREVSDSKQVLWAACANKGYFSHISTLADVQEHVQNYINVMNRPVYYLNKTYSSWSDSVAWDPRGLELMTSLAQPVYDTKNETDKKGKLVGVAGTDIPLEELKKIAPPYKLGVNGYAFAITNNGHVLFHPQFRPLKDKMIKPNFNSVDLSEVELPLSAENVEDIYTQETKLRLQMIQQLTNSFTMSVKIPYDDMKRVAIRENTYYYTSLDNTPFSLGIALPFDYGSYELDGRLNLNEVDFNSKFSYWAEMKLAPWDYCKPLQEDINMDKMQMMLKYMNLGKAGDPVYRERCNDDLIQHLLFDLKATDEVLTNWMKQNKDSQRNDERSKENGIELLFLGTKAGLTRYYKIVKDLTEPDFIENNTETINSLYYERAVEGQEDTITISVPFDADKKLMVNSTVVTTMVTPIIISNDNGNEAVAAVVGLQMNYRNFTDIFEQITTSSPSESCQGADVDCYLLDNNGFIVYSETPSEVGKFLGTIDGNLLSELTLESEYATDGGGVFKKVQMFDYQGVCEIWQRGGSGASSLVIDPFRRLFNGLTYFFHELFLIIIQFNFWNWWNYGYVSAGPGDLDIQSISSQEELIDGVLQVVYELAGSEEVPKWKETLFHTMDYSSRDVVVELYHKIKKQYNPRLIGKESCNYQWPLFKAYIDYLPKSSMMDLCIDSPCNRAYSMHHVPRTNLMLLAVSASCNCITISPIDIKPSRVEYNDTAICEKLKRQLSRRSPEECYSTHKDEDSTECGGASEIRSHYLLLTILSVTALLVNAPH